VAKLNQIIAVSKGVKSQTLRTLTDGHRDVQKPALLSGLSRTYQPKDDEGERLPPESTKVQLTANAVISDITAALVRLFDVVATQDYANRVARADVVVDGRVIAADVPVTYLLFLEKQLTDLHTFVDKLPFSTPRRTGPGPRRPDTTRPTRADHPDEEGAAQPRQGEATEKHPAQVEMYTEDVIVGTWTTIKFSGRCRRPRSARYASG